MKWSMKYLIAGALSVFPICFVIQDEQPVIFVNLERRGAKVEKTAMYAVLAKKEYIDRLISCLDDHDANSRESCASILGAIGPPARDAAPSLFVAFKDKDPFVRRSVVYAIGQLGSGVEGVIPALAQALGDQDKVVRWIAVNSLYDLAPAAGEAIPALILALMDEDEVVRTRAHSTLNRILSLS